MREATKLIAQRNSRDGAFGKLIRSYDNEAIRNMKTVSSIKFSPVKDTVKNISQRQLVEVANEYNKLKGLDEIYDF